MIVKAGFLVMGSDDVLCLGAVELELARVERSLTETGR